MASMKIILLFSFLACTVQALPTPIPTYTVDFFLLRKELQYALQDVIAYKEATGSRLDPLPNPPTAAENSIRFVIEELRVFAFYAYDKLIFLSNSQLVTLAYATQTFTWYEKAFYHLAGRIEQLIPAIPDDTIKLELQSLLDQIVFQTALHHYNVELLLTTV